MGSASQALGMAVPFELPFMLERGASNTITFPITILNGEDIDRSFEATIKVISPSGSETTLVSGQVVDPLGPVSVVWEIGANTTLGDGYVVTLTMVEQLSSQTWYQFRNDAMIVRTVLACPVSSANLYRVVTSLNPSASKPIHNMTTLDTYVVEAWTRIQRRLIERGNRPNLVMSPSAFHDVAVLLSLALVFEDFATRLNAAYMDQARMYREQYETAWSRLTFVYDTTDGGIGGGLTRRSSSPSLFLGTSRGRL